MTTHRNPVTVECSARSRGRADAMNGVMINDLPAEYRGERKLHLAAAWRNGWADQRDAMREAGVIQPRSVRY